jgi:hypothetical protein
MTNDSHVTINNFIFTKEELMNAVTEMKNPIALITGVEIDNANLNIDIIDDRVLENDGSVYEVWYQNKMEFYHDEEHPPNPPKDMTETHTKVAKIFFDTNEGIWQNLEMVFYIMNQAWSPEGEMNDLIRTNKLHHTSMSIGDIVKTPSGIYMTEKRGFDRIDEGR